MKSVHSGATTDPCNHHILNIGNNRICAELSTLFNSSLTTVTLTEYWKHAEVKPLLKKPSADPSKLKNYRPISLLPFPTKVLEKATNSRNTWRTTIS